MGKGRAGWVAAGILQAVRLFTWRKVWLSRFLENLVHMTRHDYPTGYVVVAAAVPDHVRIAEHLRYLDSKPSDTTSERAAGDRWLQNSESAVLRVPSAVVAGDWNYLINPQHLDFAQIAIEPPMPFQFDERLFGPADPVSPNVGHEP